jgi:hypothetical protein
MFTNLFRWQQQAIQSMSSRLFTMEHLEQTQLSVGSSREVGEISGTRGVLLWMVPLRSFKCLVSSIGAGFGLCLSLRLDKR